MAKRILLDEAEAAERLDGKRGLASVEIEFNGRCYGGMPGTKDGVAAFVAHHLKLVGEEADAAAKRIMGEEVGEIKTTPEGGEVSEVESYGVAVFRHTPRGAYIVPHQLKGCMKEAGTRLGYFAKKPGSKGDVVEMGTFAAAEQSMQVADDPTRIHFYRPDGEPTGDVRYFENQRGCVGTPKGRKSIVSDREYVEGVRLAFTLRWMPTKMSAEMVADIFSAMREIGLGSARTFSGGRFRIVKAEISVP